MTKAEKQKMLTWNTLLWIAAMILPAGLHLALQSTKFPWIVILPCLLLGPLLASNGMLSRAIGEPTDAVAERKP
jgi:hypothetical protein